MWIKKIKRDSYFFGEALTDPNAQEVAVFELYAEALFKVGDKNELPLSI